MATNGIAEDKDRINFQISKSDLAKLDAQAESAGLKRSQYLRKILKPYIEGEASIEYRHTLAGNLGVIEGDGSIAKRKKGVIPARQPEAGGGTSAANQA